MSDALVAKSADSLKREKSPLPQDNDIPSSASPSEPDADAIKMFVGQIPRNWNEIDCRQLFETYGPVFSCNILRDKSTQVSKGCCFVTFYHRKDAISAQGALHNIKVIDGMHHPIQMKPADTENRNERKLFIGQLSKKHTEEDLKEMFSKFGQIEDCSVLRDQEGKSRGCAFVTFVNRSCAVLATKGMHHSQTMEGCAAPLVVKFADTQKDKDVKQKTVVSNGNILGGANANLLQQLSGGQNLQAFASLLSLLGNNQSSPVPQQNVLGLLGSGIFCPQPVSQPTIDVLTQAHLSQIAQQNPYLNLQGYQQQQQQTPHPVQVSQPGLGGGLANAKTASPVAATIPTAAISLAPYPTAATTSLDQYHAVALQQQYSLLTNLQQQSLPMAQSINQVAGNGEVKGPEGANLFIYHLPQEFTDTDLHNTFSGFGNVLSAKVFIDKVTNLSKCFGFVSFDNATSANNAIQAMNGFQIGSKRLKVQLKVERGNPYNR